MNWYYFHRISSVLLAVLLFTAIAMPAEGIAKEQPLRQQVQQINQLVDQGRWDHALNEAQVALETYKKTKWKLQLFGDEREYEGLDQEFAKLIAAIQEKEKAQTKMQLAAIRSLLKNIYSI